VKTASTQLEAFLETGLPFFMADLYDITPVGGSTFRATSFDRPISYGGNTYPVARYGSNAPCLERSAVKMAVGLVASKLDIEVKAGPDALVAGQPFLQQLAAGFFANAAVTVRRAFMTYGDVHYNDGIPNGAAICNLTGAPGGTGDGTLVWFAGTVGTVSDITPLAAKIEVRDIVYQLNRPTPKDLISPGCWHALFDAGCTLNSSSFTTTGAVSAGCTTTVIQTGLTNDVGIPTSPTSAPTMTHANTGVTLAAATYYAVATYTTALGETLASPEGSNACPPNNVPTVTGPGSVTGSTGWNCYIGLQSGNEQKQNGIPIPIGTTYTVPNNGIYLTGITPPAFPTSGYWSQGVITFTSGANNGLSAFVEASASSGAVKLRTPLPVAPTVGDTFSIIPGCDKSQATCKGKFNNLAHFTGFPFVPTPESGL
jgi:hypothetical protein